MSLVGRLEDISLADILQILSIGKKTGTLTIRSDRESAFIVFKGGLIVRAETTTLEGNIGTDLVKFGIVKESILAMAGDIKEKLPHRSMPEILFDLGAVSRDLLEKAAKKRIERVISCLIALNGGDFRFEMDNVDVSDFGSAGADTGWEISKGLSAQYLLMEGARVYDEQMGQQHVEEDIAGEEKEEAWGDEEGQPDAAGRKDIFALKSLTQELRFPNSTSEITLLILRFASDIFERGVLFMVGDHELAGLGQFGLDMEMADEKIRETRIPFEESSFLQRIIAGGHPYRGTMEKDAFTTLFITEIGEQWPVQVAFFPLIAENKVVALLYCDNSLSGEDFAETEGLEIFIDQAGLALEKSLLQKRLQDMQKGMKI